MKDKEWIEDRIDEIMAYDGPDGHTDGSYIIADFIDALLKGNEDEWINEYRTTKEREGKTFN